MRGGGSWGSGLGVQPTAQAILAGNPEMKHFHIILEGKLLTHSKKHSHLSALSKPRQASNKELSLLETCKSASTAQ